MDRATSYILTHHKCATEWMVGYLADLCQRNGLALFHSHCSDVLAGGEEIAILTNASYDICAGEIAGGLHVIRNPLSIVVSAYHSHRTTHSTNGWPQLVAQRDLLQRVDQHDGLFLTLSFLERDDFHPDAVGPLHALRHWDFADERFIPLKMEDAVTGPNGSVGSWLKRQRPDLVLPPEADHTFEAITGRRPGEVDETSHFRSGKADQWRSVLPGSLSAYIQAHYRPLLERFYPEALA